MSGIELGGNAQNVMINGIDVLRVGKMILNPSLGKSQTTAEINIANRVRGKMVKMITGGYSAKHTAQFVRKQVIAEAQALKPAKQPNNLQHATIPKAVNNRPVLNSPQKPIHREH